ncbi:MAG: alpha/beta-type small acid-soluble spore protein [Clostridium sp.]|uniref:small, acid-soluble spore protein, alpha/beta type n=1 Tax=Clostridium sp. DSM 8431 TaxID=1761781 RepID=UPI0008F39FCC|nr:small, acid-soluble spore protein, alpha/beta type [Clostridium sp. DSM 8431]MCR4944054.1 alpha/beta-type small acid-soluble spore protein [Clostridium sp.]SFU60493.1 Small, acid-soluble spore protein, alpha/beta type [Clostridium sp. DSM 8431]
MGNTPLKKIIKAKIKNNKELTKEEVLREKIKYEIAEELGLKDKVDSLGWGGLTSEETGRIGGIMTKRKKQLHIPSNNEILGRKN